MRAPAPWLVGDEGLMGVEAGEVVNIGVVVLSGSSARPGHEGGVAALLGELASGCLASIVFGTLDPHRPCQLPRGRATRVIRIPSFGLSVMEAYGSTFWSGTNSIPN